MTGKMALVIANGEVDCQTINRISREKWDSVIAADGGALKALACGLTPDTVVGDLDSARKMSEEQKRGIRLVHRPSQELNDLEKTLLYCQEQGFRQLLLLGVTGERSDHTLNNFSVLARYRHRFKMRIYDRYSEILWAEPDGVYAAEIGQVVSLIPLGKAEGIRTEGLKYPLRDETLEFGMREGLSNVVTASPFRVRLRAGLLLLFINRMNSDD